MWMSYTDTVVRDGFSSRMRAAFVEGRPTCPVLFFYPESLLRLIGGNLPKREANLLESEADGIFSNAQALYSRLHQRPNIASSPASKLSPDPNRGRFLLTASEVSPRITQCGNDRNQANFRLKASKRLPGANLDSPK
jgi:hypothetical protein